MRYSKMMMMIQKILNEKSDVSIDFCMSSEMARRIELWSRLYEDHPPWKSETVKTMNLPATIAGEIARLVTLELKSEVKGSARASYINKAYQKVLKNLRIYAEYGCAKGGLIFKPYPSLNGINVQVIQADGFFPISFDSSGKISQCVFLEQFRKGNKVYSRIEIHNLQNRILTIENRVYLSTNNFTLGSEIGIGTVDRWKDLAPSVTFSDVERLPVGYFKVPLANAEDSDSPLGVSVFSRAVELIHEADRRYSQVNWEYDAKEAAVHIAQSLLKVNPQTQETEYPEGKERLYRSFEYNVGAQDKPLLDTFSPDIRDQSYFNGLNKQLRLIEFACCLAYGTLSDPNNVDKTAEEIKSSKQRSYQMVSDTQGALQDALDDLLYAIDFYCTVYDLAPTGNYSATYVWDDSIIVDTNAVIDKNVKLTQASLRSKLTAIMEICRCTEQEALEELQRIADEGQITGQDIDWTNGDNDPEEEKPGKEDQDGDVDEPSGKPTGSRAD